MSGSEDTAIGLLRELLDNSQPFMSAIEMDHGYDGEAWAERARAVIGEETVEETLARIRPTIKAEFLPKVRIEEK